MDEPEYGSKLRLVDILWFAGFGILFLCVFLAIGWMITH
jgi:hypothetical protein